MRIQSIPAVYAFKDGRPVDGFVGAVPESQIKQFVEQARRRRRGAVADRGGAWRWPRKRWQTGDSRQRRQHLQPGPAARARQYRRARRPGARADRQGGDYAQRARAARRVSPDEQLNHADDRRGACARWSSPSRRRRPWARPTSTARGSPPMPTTTRRARARHGAVRRRRARGRHRRAADALSQRDRAWNEEAARKQLVKFFEAMGADRSADPRSRRRLSSLMFS